MKLITLTASETNYGKKVLLGKLDNFPVPESLEEMIEMTEKGKISEEDLVSCFVSGWKVRSQAQIRSGADPKAPVSVFKKANAANQAKILELAKAQGLL